jgi:hypothetical protein
MENRDSGGVDATAGFTAAARNFHAFAAEVGRLSHRSFARNAELVENLIAARDVSDIVAIQTRFVAGLFETFQEQLQLLTAWLAELPGARFGSPEATAAPDVEETAGGLKKAVEPAGAPAASAIDSRSTPPEAAQIADEAPPQAADATNEAQKAEETEDAGEEEEGEKELELQVEEVEEPEEEDSGAALQHTAKAGREAWQELAKVAAELMRAEAEELQRAAGQQSDSPPPSDASAQQA